MFLMILFLLPAGLVLLSGYSYPRRLAAAAAVPPVGLAAGGIAPADARVAPVLPSTRGRRSPDSLPAKGADTVIRVAVSDTFSIVLAASFGEGYSWQFGDSAFSRKIRYLWQDHHPTGVAMPGSRDLQVFYFKALAPGTAQIRLIYVQPFKHPYRSNAPHKTVSIIIH